MRLVGEPECEAPTKSLSVRLVGELSVRLVGEPECEVGGRA